MNRPFLLLSFIILFAVTGAFFFTDDLFSPGDLNEKHARIIECAACHEPFVKPTGKPCVVSGCHDSGYWDKRKGVILAHLEKDGCINCHTDHKGQDGSMTLSLPHQNIAPDANCLDCHRLGKAHGRVKTADCKNCHGMNSWRPAKFDHSGISKDQTCASCHKMPEKHVGSEKDCGECHEISTWKLKTFDHSKLAARDNCKTCHQLPVKHVATDGKCGLCHATDKWKPATFDHSMLKADDNCAPCHALPPKHFQTSGDCRPCHGTDKWKPATFKHRFPMDHENRRNWSCESCHPESLDKYDCYGGCHEHSPFKVQRKHEEEGIREFGDCLKCHPTGREHESQGSRRHHEHEEEDDDDD